MLMRESPNVRENNALSAPSSIREFNSADTGKFAVFFFFSFFSREESRPDPALILTAFPPDAVAFPPRGETLCTPFLKHI